MWCFGYDDKSSQALHLDQPSSNHYFSVGDRGPQVMWLVTAILVIDALYTFLILSDAIASILVLSDAYASPQVAYDAVALININQVEDEH